MKVAFRVDASNEIGTGHLMRCLTLADVLKQRGAQIRFVSRHLPNHLWGVLGENGHEITSLNSSRNKVETNDPPHIHWLGASQTADAQDTVRALSDQTWDWLVVDHYALDAQWESSLRGSVSRILVIDDIADRVHDCDVLLDQNFYADMVIRYTGKVPAHCQLLLGPRYALLREEFRRVRKQVKSRIGPVKRILIFFGGVDVNNYTARAIEALTNIGIPDLYVDVVIGSQHPCREQIVAECFQHGYACHVQTNRMAELMAAADLAIGAGGSTTWERCCLGLPTIVFAVAENQEQASRALANGGAAYLVRNEMVVAEIKGAVKHFLVSHRLHEMSIKAAEHVDGQGVIRLNDILFRGVSQ